MLYIKDNGTIRLTRGDTARLTIPITNSANSDEYIMQSGTAGRKVGLDRP